MRRRRHPPDDIHWLHGRPPQYTSVYRMDEGPILNELGHLLVLLHLLGIKSATRELTGTSGSESTWYADAEL